MQVSTIASASEKIQAHWHDADWSAVDERLRGLVSYDTAVHLDMPAEGFKAFWQSTVFRGFNNGSEDGARLLQMSVYMSEDIN